jgi:antitoxin (DNA-binding transcriptional repressor) of toxin-antitoxin stability system
MASIGISDPDANLIQLLERLATGEKIIITRDGEPEMVEEGRRW